MKKLFKKIQLVSIPDSLTTDSESAAAAGSASRKKGRPGRPRKHPKVEEGGVTRKVWKVGSRGRRPKDITEEEERILEEKLKGSSKAAGDSTGDSSAERPTTKEGGKKLSQLKINGFLKKTGAVVSKRMADQSLLAEDVDEAQV